MASGQSFTCNVCGTVSAGGEDDRESAGCSTCRSSARIRAVVLVLSRALFGADLALTEFPVLKSVRGLGISDSDIYANRLAGVFSYTNTFYHREPFFDLTRPDETEFGRYDFVICSDVLEHIPPPADIAFHTLAKLLKPSGVLILTLPYSLEPATIEHFPRLREFGILDLGGKSVLVNRVGDGYEVHDRLVFHNGPGHTLEMRVFTEAEVRSKLMDAGLTEVLIQSPVSQEFGVCEEGPCSLPILARRQPFELSASGVNELVSQWVEQKRLVAAVGESRWVQLGRRLSVGPDVRKR
jgi:SAM-dependent methyltransferase